MDAASKLDEVGSNFGDDSHWWLEALFDVSERD